MPTSTYAQFTKFINGNIPSIRQLPINRNKEYWIRELKNRDFSETYIITRVPRILKQYGIHSTYIYMSLENMAYILSRHNQEYSVDSYLKMKETIDDNDLLLHGEHNNNLDYRFYKIFLLNPDKLNDRKNFGIEIVIDKKEDFYNEMIVHMNYVGKTRKRYIRRYIDLSNDNKLIDRNNELMYNSSRKSQG